MGDYYNISHVIGAVSDISLSLSEDGTLLCNGEPIENTTSTSTDCYTNYFLNPNTTVVSNSEWETVDEIYEKLMQKIECNKTEKEMKNETNKPKSGIPFSILPEVTDVQIINNKVVILTFADGTTTKSVTDEADEFVLETGISICLMKRILMHFKGGNGSGAYNRLIEDVEKVYLRKIEAERKAAEEKEIRKRRAEKAKRKRIIKARREQEQRINEQAEAYRRAFELMATKKAMEEHSSMAEHS